MQWDRPSVKHTATNVTGYVYYFSHKENEQSDFES